MIQKKIEGINIVPFVDIMLVLLVVVLMSATFVSRGSIPVNLPRAESELEDKSLQEREVTIRANGELYFEGKMASLDTIGQRIGKLDKETHIVIRADALSPLEHLVALLGVLQGVGIDNISIITQKP
ncbi:MAG: ExbD/TolR family protein [Wolinella sp.]